MFLLYEFLLLFFLVLGVIIWVLNLGCYNFNGFVYMIVCEWDNIVSEWVLLLFL